MVTEVTNESETEDRKKISFQGVITLIFMAILIVAVVGMGAWMFMNQKKEEKSEQPIPYFTELEPFVITLKNKSRPHYLQLKLSLMTRNPDALDIIDTYRPMIRNEILRYLNALQYDDVLKSETPDVIRAESISLVNNLLTKEKVETKVDDLIITDLVIQ